MKAEIPRYHWTSAGMQKGCEQVFNTMPFAPLVIAAESEAWHLADKTAALEAQAEEHKTILDQQGNEMAARHESELKFRDRIHGERIDAKDEEHEKALESADALRIRVCEAARRRHGLEVEALLRQRAESNRLSETKHAAELAARDEQLEVALSQQILWQRRHDEVKAEIEQIKRKYCGQEESEITRLRAELAALRGEGEAARVTLEEVNSLGCNSALHDNPFANESTKMQQLNLIGRLLLEIRDGRKESSDA